MLSIIVLLYALGASLMVVTIRLAEKMSPAIEYQASGKVICVMFWPLAAFYIMAGSLV